MNTKEYIDRPFNARPIVLWAVLAGLTLVAANFNLWALIVWLVLLSGIATLIIMKRTGSKTTLICIGGLIVCLIITSSYFITTSVHSGSQTFRGSGEIRGTVRSFNINEYGNGNFVLSDASFQGEPVQGRIRVFVRYLDNDSVSNIQSRNIVSVTNFLRNTDANSFNINNRIRYTARSGNTPVSFVGGARDVRSIVTGRVDSFLHSHMSKESATLMFSMLFGDRNNLDEEIREEFALTGIAHVLSASGLHVGLIVGLLLSVLKALKTDKRIQIVVLILAVGFYAYLCDFRVPIVRSSIMFLVLAWARLFYIRRLDFLSAISLAWIVVLILFPYSFFSASFRMTFACMFGIALFHRPISRWLDKHMLLLNRSDTPELGVDHNTTNRVRGGTFRRGVIHSIALCIATDITLSPFLIYYFGGYPVIGVFANLAILPILVLAFKAVVTGVITIVGFPLLILVDPFVRFAISANSWISGLGLYIPLTMNGAWYLFYFLGLILVSRFIFLKNNLRWSLASVFFLVYFLVLLIQNI